MTEKPILFSAPMVRALLDGRKMQTRRLMDVQRLESQRRISSQAGDRPGDIEREDYRDCALSWSPYGQVGDRLWVRETFSAPFDLDVKAKRFTGFYRASDAERRVRWKPSIHMPRWVSRLTLEITTVRVERLNDITEADALAEGVEVLSHGFKNYLGADLQCGDARMSYMSLWETINGPGSWALNPWVWVLEFKVIHSEKTLTLQEPVEKA